MNSDSSSPLRKIPSLMRVAAFSMSTPSKAATFASVCEDWREAATNYSGHTFAKLLLDGNILFFSHSIHRRWLFLYRLLTHGQPDTLRAVFELGIGALLAMQQKAKNDKIVVLLQRIFCHQPMGQHGETPACVVAARREFGAAGIEMLRKTMPWMLRTRQDLWAGNVASVDQRGLSYLDHAVMAGNKEAVRAILRWMHEQQQLESKAVPQQQLAPLASSSLPDDAFVTRGLLTIPAYAGPYSSPKLERWSHPSRRSCDKHIPAKKPPPGPTDQHKNRGRHGYSTVVLACDIAIVDGAVTGEDVVEIVEDLLAAITGSDAERIRTELLCGRIGAGAKSTTMLHRAFANYNLPLIKFILESVLEKGRQQQQQKMASSAPSANNPLHGLPWNAMCVVDDAGRYPAQCMFKTKCGPISPSQSSPDEQRSRYQFLPARFFRSGECARAAKSTLPILSFLSQFWTHLGIPFVGMRGPAEAAIASLDYALALQNSTTAAAAATASAAAAASPAAASHDIAEAARKSQPDVVAAHVYVEILLGAISKICEAKHAAASAASQPKKYSLVESLLSFTTSDDFGHSALTIGASFRARYSSRANDHFLRRLLTMIEKDSNSMPEQKLNLLASEAVMWSWWRPGRPAGYRIGTWCSDRTDSLNDRSCKITYPTRFTALELSILCCREGPGPEPVFERLMRWATETLNAGPEVILSRLLRVWREDPACPWQQASRSKLKAQLTGFSSSVLQFALVRVPGLFATEFFVNRVFPEAVALAKRCTTAEVGKDVSQKNSLSIADLRDDIGHGPLAWFCWSGRGAGPLHPPPTHLLEKLALLLQACGDDEEQIQSLCGPAKNPATGSGAGAAGIGMTPLHLFLCWPRKLEYCPEVLLMANRVAALMGKEKVNAAAVNIRDIRVRQYGRNGALNSSLASNLAKLEKQGLTAVSPEDLAKSNYQWLSSKPTFDVEVDGKKRMYILPRDAQQILCNPADSWV